MRCFTASHSPQVDAIAGENETVLNTAIVQAKAASVEQSMIDEAEQTVAQGHSRPEVRSRQAPCAENTQYYCLHVWCFSELEVAFRVF